MSGLGPLVRVLWSELGMAPPLDQFGGHFDFELGEMPVSLDLQDNGETVLLRGRIGFLEANPHEAGDQLARVFRLGLGLTALNGAVLDAAEAEDLLERDHVGLVPVYAVAFASLTAPKSVLPALQAVLEWQSVTESILAQGDGEAGSDVTRQRSAGPEPEAEMIIFQP